MSYYNNNNNRKRSSDDKPKQPAKRSGSQQNKNDSAKNLSSETSVPAKQTKKEIIKIISEKQLSNFIYQIKTGLK